MHELLNGEINERKRARLSQVLMKRRYLLNQKFESYFVMKYTNIKGNDEFILMLYTIGNKYYFVLRIAHCFNVSNPTLLFKDRLRIPL